MRQVRRGDEQRGLDVTTAMRDDATYGPAVAGVSGAYLAS